MSESGTCNMLQIGSVDRRQHEVAIHAAIVRALECMPTCTTLMPTTLDRATSALVVS